MVLGVGGRREAESRGRRRKPPRSAPTPRSSSGRTPASVISSVTPSSPASARRQLAERVGLTGPGAARDRHPRAATERRQPLDRRAGRILGAEPEPLGRERRREIVEATAVGEIGGRFAVDRIDPKEGREALGALRRTAGPADDVAADELAALGLSGRDVDVAVRRIGRRDADEAGAVRKQLNDAFDTLVAILRLVAAGSSSAGFGRGFLGALARRLLVIALRGRAARRAAASATPSAPPRAPVAVSSAASCSSAAAWSSVAADPAAAASAALLLGGGLLLRAAPPRRPRRRRAAVTVSSPAPCSSAAACLLSQRHLPPPPRPPAPRPPGEQ